MSRWHDALDLTGDLLMRIRCGYQISFDCPQPVPIQATLSVHPSRRRDLETPDFLRTDPVVDVRQYIDSFGNNVLRVLAPAGRFTLSSDFVIRDSGEVDEYAPDVEQIAVHNLPDETLIYLLGSRYCETDRLSELAWSTARQHAAGLGPGPGDLRLGPRPHRLRLPTGAADQRAPTTSIAKGSRRLPRLYRHLAVALCRCVNIPARCTCTGYLGDIGVPLRPAHGFQRLVPRPIWAAAGTPLTPATTSPASAAS